MNYKDTLFFIGQCLTINHEEHNKILVEEKLKTDDVNWDNIVKVSTAHYVFPALYCNLKRADFLHYLPNDLVEYMHHITDLNRARNQQIIEQAKEINVLLLRHNITPIFLKGTGNLLSGLYEDIGERMVGDIDFLVDKNDANRVFNILVESGYSKQMSDFFDDHRHLPRIVNPKRIAAIEVHKEMILASKKDYFNIEHVKSSIHSKNKIHFLSIENKIKLSIFSKLINDDHYFLKDVSLKIAYDVFLLGNKLKSTFTIDNSPLSKHLKAGLKIYTSVLHNTEYLPELIDDFSQKYYASFLKSLSSNKTPKRKFLWFLTRFSILQKSLYNKSHLNFVLSKLTNLNWYKKKLGLTKTNS